MASIFGLHSNLLGELPSQFAVWKPQPTDAVAVNPVHLSHTLPCCVQMLLYSMKRPQVLTPQTRPNLAMLMIDSAVLLTTTVRDLCGRLHSAHLVPLECPILVMKVKKEMTKHMFRNTQRAALNTVVCFRWTTYVAQQCVHDGKPCLGLQPSGKIPYSS